MDGLGETREKKSGLAVIIVVIVPGSLFRSNTFPLDLFFSFPGPRIVELGYSIGRGGGGERERERDVGSGKKRGAEVCSGGGRLLSSVSRERERERRIQGK